MTSAAIIKQLKADGWFLVHTVGSHHQFRHPTKPGKVTVPHPEEGPSAADGAQHPQASRPVSAPGPRSETMLYPVYVHPGDAKHAHGVTFPDFLAARRGRRIGRCPTAIQDAVQAHFHGEGARTVPAPPRLKCSPLIRSLRAGCGCWPMWT